MKFVIGLAISLLGFILFLSLSLFGVALTLNVTVLNPDFVVRELEKLDVISLAEELLDDVVVQMEVPEPYEPYVAEVLDKTLVDLEPWIREQANTAVYVVHDYLTGESRILNLTISLEPVRDSISSPMPLATCLPPLTLWPITSSTRPPVHSPPKWP